MNYDAIGESPGERVVTLSGDYDVRRARELKQVLIAGRDSTPVSVDCAGVGFMDSTGLKALIEARIELIERGSQLTLHSVPDSLRMLFEVTGLAASYLDAD
jgi:anti-sigma B factor antagonist